MAFRFISYPVARGNEVSRKYAKNIKYLYAFE